MQSVNNGSRASRLCSSCAFGAGSHALGLTERCRTRGWVPRSVSHGRGTCKKAVMGKAAGDTLLCKYPALAVSPRVRVELGARCWGGCWAPGGAAMLLGRWVGKGVQEPLPPAPQLELFGACPAGASQQSHGCFGWAALSLHLFTMLVLLLDAVIQLRTN